MFLIANREFWGKKILVYVLFLVCFNSKGVKARVVFLLFFCFVFLGGKRMGRHFGVLIRTWYQLPRVPKKLDGFPTQPINICDDGKDIPFLLWSLFLVYRAIFTWRLDKVCISAAAKLVVLISEMGSWVNNDPVSLFVTMDSRPDALQMMKNPRRTTTTTDDWK